MGISRMGPIAFQQPVQCSECEGEGKYRQNKNETRKSF